MKSFKHFFTESKAVDKEYSYIDRVERKNGIYFSAKDVHPDGTANIWGTILLKTDKPFKVPPQDPEKYLPLNDLEDIQVIGDLDFKANFNLIDGKWVYSGFEQLGSYKCNRSIVNIRFKKMSTVTRYGKYMKESIFNILLGYSLRDTKKRLDDAMYHNADRLVKLSKINIHNWDLEDTQPEDFRPDQ
jgi:hypothetical protein